MTETIKKLFSELVEKDFDDEDVLSLTAYNLSNAGNLYSNAKNFVRWCCEKGFENESFKNFCEYVEVFQVKDYDILYLLSGYTSRVDFICDWIAKTEVEEFLNYCKYNLSEDEKKEIEEYEFGGFLKRGKIKAIFSEQVESNFKGSDLYRSAEMFIWWCYERDFKLESFEDFCDYIEFNRIEFDNTLWELSGYTSVLNFAEDWVYDPEIKDFLDFCKDEFEEIEGFYDFLNQEMKHLIYLYNKHLAEGK